MLTNREKGLLKTALCNANTAQGETNKNSVNISDDNNAISDLAEVVASLAQALDDIGSALAEE